MSATESADVVHCQLPRPGVAVLTIDRLERRNALNTVVKQQLAEHLRRLETDDSVSVVILTGAGGIFVAGTDLAEMSTMTPTQHVLQLTGEVFMVLSAFCKPVIAAVEGYALGGGCELALACDMIVAGRSARFAQPEIRVGIMPGAGGSQRLLRAIGKYRALKLIFTGEPVGAETALAMGMLSEVVETGAALSRSIELASQIAGMPPLAVRSIKEVMRAGQNMTLDAALLLERKAFQLLFDTADQREGMRAFLEKRSPNYRGA